MSTTTENLKLFKYDTSTDSNLPFNINEALNENWDKIDEFSQNVGGTWGSITGTLSNQTDLSTALGNKVNTSSLAEVNTMIASYVNGTSGYNIWSNGYCEQWGEASVSGNSHTTVTLSKTYSGLTFALTVTPETTTVDNMDGWGCTRTSTNTIYLTNGYGTTSKFSWTTKGYLAEGEY